MVRNSLLDNLWDPDVNSYRQLQALVGNVFFQCTSAISTLDMLQRCALHTYILLTYFLTYLLTLRTTAAALQGWDEVRRHDGPAP